MAGASCGRSLVWSDPATRGRSDRLPDPRFVPLWASCHLCVPLSGGLPGVGMPVWPRPVQSSPVGTGPVSRPVLSGRVSRVGRAPVSVTVWHRSRAGSPVRYPTVPQYPVESGLSRSSTVVGEAALGAFAPGRIVQWHFVLPLVPVCLAIDRRPAQPLLGAVDGLAVVPFASRVELVL